MAGSKEGRTYRRLAAWARCHGFRLVTRHAIRKWVLAGLLPRVERHYEGWGAPRFCQPIGTGRQLLQLCHYRYGEGLGRHDVIATNLLLDGYVVDLRQVWSGMAWANHMMVAQARRLKTHGREAPHAAIAHAFATDPTGMAALPGVDVNERAALLYELASPRSGPLSDFARRTLERTTGLPRGMAQRIESGLAPPSAKELRAAMTAPDVELRTARDYLRAYPELTVGLDRVRSHRTRSVRRVASFTALLIYLRRAGVVAEDRGA